ncbi:MAG: phosphoglucosamine mutase [Planctomycetota bacterium]|nr:phosphoglucosamine mutase [Planctomycetota bacterium]
MTGGEIFGTDGIRGLAGDGWLAAKAVHAVGVAAGGVMSHGALAPALLGHDGRRSGPLLEAALAAGLAQAGIEARSVGMITTPGLAWLVRNGDFGLGCMLSASHNPAEDNGIKLFSAQGGKPTDEDQAAMEQILGGAQGLAQLPEVDVDTFSSLESEPELERSYLDYLIRSENLSLKGRSIVVDCAHGGGSHVAPDVLRALGAEVHALACSPTGDNINESCGSTHPEAMQEAVREHKAHLGIALDGDGDRCILADECGELVHGDGIMTVIGRHAAKSGKASNKRIVATVMSNRGLNRALREVGVEVLEVGVGDRAVVEGMRQHNLALGGEQSGHIILGGENGFIGDGMLTALRVLSVMRATGQVLSKLAAPYKPYPQVLLNTPVASKPVLEAFPEVMTAVREVEEALGKDGRVLLRYSGTENVARVMVEGPDEPLIQAQAQALADCIQTALRQSSP